MKELVCIVCPQGCHLSVQTDNGTLTVTGQGCERGQRYGIQEMTAPVRMVTSTVAVNGCPGRLSVKTSCPIPKEKVAEAMEAIIAYRGQLPVKAGQVLIPHFLGTEADLVACKGVD